MAQNFRRYTLNGVGTTAQDIPSGSNFPTGYHTIISIRLANVTANMILVDAYINDGTNDISLIQAAPLPAGSSLELIDGGSKIVTTDTDRLYVKSDTAASLDAHCSVVQEIST
jgi:hypothetical protein